MRFSANRAREQIPIEIHLSNGQTLNWNLDALNTKVVKLKSSHLFVWAIIIFIVGVVIQIIGFSIENKKEKT